jgi:hypothetical protein
MRNRLLVVFMLTVIICTVAAQSLIAGDSKKDVKISLKTAIPSVKQPTIVKDGVAPTYPYFEYFDSDIINTDGWLISDPSLTVLTSNSFNMQTGTLAGLSALSGSNYLISGFDKYASRNAWAFSPAFSLTAGVTYHIYIYTYAKGYNGTKDEFKITVGTNQTAASQTTVIINKTGANAVAVSAWTRYEGTFTPASAGSYCFGINHCTAAMDVNAIAFENFVLSDKVYVEPPKVDIFTTGGLQSVTNVINNSVYLTSSEQIKYIVKLTNATSFKWGFDVSASASSTSDSISIVTYSTEGTHIATINAVGSGGSSVGTATHNIKRPQENVTSDLVFNFKSYDQPATIFFTDYNYLVGPNAYYKKMAEKYTLPNNSSVSISQIYLNLGAYNLSTANLSKNVIISILKADGANGLPGSVVTTATTTYENLFGATTISSSTSKSFTLATPVTVNGSFYIAIDFSTITTPGSSNYIGLVSTSSRKYNDASFYLFYNNAWVSSATLIPNGQLSAYIAPKITFLTPIRTPVENPSFDDLVVSVSDHKLYIHNAIAGNRVNVYNLVGDNIFSSILNANDAMLPITLKSGIYLVKVAQKVSKVIVR